MTWIGHLHSAAETCFSLSGVGTWVRADESLSPDDLEFGLVCPKDL